MPLLQYTLKPDGLMVEVFLNFKENQAIEKDGMLPIRLIKLVVLAGSAAIILHNNF